MKIHKLTLYTQQDGSHGFIYSANKAFLKHLAATFRRDNKGKGPETEVETLEIEPTRAGIVEALNRHGGHEQNG